MKEGAIENRRLKLIEGNIVLLDVDAIVNPANTSLILGGGVAGAIHRFGGPKIQEECDKIGPIRVGEAVMTGGGDLKARYVIHAAGPVYGDGNEEVKLTSTTLSCLNIARERKLKNIAFPAISTGTFGFPMQECSVIMLKVVLEFLQENVFPGEIIMCLYGQEAFDIFSRTLETLVP